MFGGVPNEIPAPAFDPGTVHASANNDSLDFSYIRRVFFEQLRQLLLDNVARTAARYIVGADPMTVILAIATAGATVAVTVSRGPFRRPWRTP